MANVVKIQPGQLGVFLKKSVNTNKAAVRRGIRIAAARGRDYLKTISPVYDGHLKNAWEVQSGPNGEQTVSNSAPHAGIIERGARPHKVNAEGVEAIREWVIKKGIVRLLQPPGKGRMGPAQNKGLTRGQAEGEFAHMVDAVVWGIIKKLEKYGQKGTYFVQGSLPKLNKFVDEEVSRSIAESIGGGGTP